MSTFKIGDRVECLSYYDADHMRAAPRWYAGRISLVESVVYVARDDGAAWVGYLRDVRAEEHRGPIPPEARPLSHGALKR